MHKKRIRWLDFAKGVTIFFVVFVHSLGQVLETQIIGVPRDIMDIMLFGIMAFIMPIFFSISGFLYKPLNNVNDFKILLCKKISSFIIPYIVFTLILIILQHAHDIIFIILSNILNIILLPSAYLWFLYVLFFIFIIVGLMDLYHVSLISQILFSIILLVLSSCIKFQESFPMGIMHLNTKIGSINPMSGIGGYLIAFLIGRLIHKYNLMMFFSK